MLDSFRSKFARLLWLDSLDWFSAGILIALPAFALPALTLMVMNASVLWLLGISTFVYILTAIVASVALYDIDHSEYGSETESLKDWVAHRRKLIAETEVLVSEAKNGLSELKQILQCQEEYKAARKEVSRLKEIKESRRYSLQQVDWRALRGVPFEEFLADVFSVLGFTVETTKTSGDQGVDLLITGGGRRIAVQAKGYSESVGNSAVQQAYAGMAFYRCSECMVITNSSFTSSACDLASKINCRLVDGSQIPDLIHGRIISNEVSSAPNSPSAAGSGR